MQHVRSEVFHDTQQFSSGHASVTLLFVRTKQSKASQPLLVPYAHLVAAQGLTWFHALNMHLPDPDLPCAPPQCF